MARTIAEIQAEIIASKTADADLAVINSSSASAIWRRWTWVVAIAIAAHENLFDLFAKEISEEIARMKPHNPRWYRGKALSFQYGYNLVDGEDFYDNTSLTSAQILASQVVKYAAVREEGETLVIKIARDVAGEITPLTNDQVASATAYFNEIKDAGVKLSVRSFAADRLVLNIDLVYDPLILGANGQRLDGSADTPVVDAINAHLKTQPFDGLFVKSKLVDAIQVVDGVFIPEIRLCQATRSGNPALQTIDLYYSPYSGFLRVDEADLTINYIPKNVN